MDNVNNRLYKSYITILKMLKNRGYVVSDNEIKNTTLNDFISKNGLYQNDQSRNTLTRTFEKVDDPGNLILLFFPDMEKVGVKSIRKYKDIMEEEKIKKAIIVVKKSITSFVKQYLLKNTEHIFNTFTESELQIDITEHKYQPNFIVLNNTEKNKVLKFYNIKEYKLPKIKNTDPISRYYGLINGNVLKIIRPSETAGKYISYRIVCD
jgi:DNA-directed RNA polymerase I, II, and III subunit RPABC1